MSPGDALIQIIPDHLIKCWNATECVPSEVLRGLQLLETIREDSPRESIEESLSEAHALMCKAGAPRSAIDTLVLRLENSKGLGLSRLAQCNMLCDQRNDYRRPIMIEEMPRAAAWAVECYPSLGKTEAGVTLSTEIEAELARWEVQSPEVCRELAGYVHAMDAAANLHRSKVERARHDEQIEAQRKADGKRPRK